MLSLTVFLLVAGLVSSQQTEVGGYNITLSKDLTHPIPKLYGMMYEDINVSHTHPDLNCLFLFGVELTVLNDFYHLS